MVFYVKFSALCFILYFIIMIQGFGTTRDQMSPRANTLSDDKDDIQKQLDNEAKDRLHFATGPKIWVLHFPTRILQKQHSNKRIPWNFIKSKQKAKRDYNGQKKFKEWQRSQDISSSYSANRISESFTLLPIKEPQRMTVRVQLPVNRYQTKKTMLRKVDSNQRKRPRTAPPRLILPRPATDRDMNLAEFWRPLSKFQNSV
ncbi:uncharacterized protein LOC134664746 [Cydia fagiglandana]|uniref:uncharacterized protein LOC134664746 n=1 Tax=Cydia fagiglandana TaxID=1458189 RepID=UPI002FEE2A2B